MQYAFLEKMDISALEHEYLLTHYTKYATSEEISLYKLLVKQSNELNMLYSIQNIVNKLYISEQLIYTSLNRLCDLQLLEILKDKDYIFKLNKIQINSSFYNLSFVNETSFINYDKYQKMNIKQKDKLSFNTHLFKTFLPRHNIVLNENDFKKLDNFKKINNISDLKLLELVKKTYNIIDKELDEAKMNFYFKDEFLTNKQLPTSLSSWIARSSNNLYANKDKDIFIQLLNKHENLQDEQIKAIITYVYKTQKNVYYNFVDKLAITLQKEKIVNYDDALKYLNAFQSKKSQFKHSMNKVNLNKNANSKFEYDKLNRKVEKGAAVSIQDLLKQQNGK